MNNLEFTKKDEFNFSVKTNFQEVNFNVFSFDFKFLENLFYAHIHTKNGIITEASIIEEKSLLFYIDNKNEKTKINIYSNELMLFSITTHEKYRYLVEQINKIMKVLNNG